VARVLPVEPDEAQVAAAKDFLRTQRQVQQLVTGGFSSALANFTGSSSRDSRAGVGYSPADGTGSSASSSTAAVAVQTSSSSSNSERAGELSLLQQDEQLQELLRDEVVEQMGQQQQPKQQASKSTVQ
jgi:hypothetical protein